MDPAVAGLIGVGLGGVFTVASAVATARMNARQSLAAATRDAEEKKRASLEAVLDEAALALESLHWGLDAAVEAREDGVSGADWQRACHAVVEARDCASRLGTRLAIRLGPPSASATVRAYDAKQQAYRALVERVTDDDDATFDAGTARAGLDALGADKSFIESAAEILRPATLGR